jgi:putative FmdB family regulatory protein
MPIFEYVCRDCHHRFEAFVQGSQKPDCPKCESRKLEKQPSSFRVGGYKGYTVTSEGFGHAAGSPRCRTTAARKGS